MAQWVKEVLRAKPDNPTSISMTYKIEELTSVSCPLTSACVVAQTPCPQMKQDIFKLKNKNLMSGLKDQENAKNVLRGGKQVPLRAVLMLGWD